MFCPNDGHRELLVVQALTYSISAHLGERTPKKLKIAFILKIRVHQAVTLKLLRFLFMSLLLVKGCILHMVLKDLLVNVEC